MKFVFLILFAFSNLIIVNASFSQSKNFCASDAVGKKYELNLVEGAGRITAKTYSSSGVLIGTLNGTWSIQNEGVYGSAYFLTAVFSSGTMKFLVISDGTGDIQKLQDVVANREFYPCNGVGLSSGSSISDGSNYSWNQEKKSNTGKIIIGSQVWSSENLSITTFQNGDEIPEAKTNEEWIMYLNEKKPAWCQYDNSVENRSKYGVLYNWYALNDPRGLAPTGWRIPSQDDWNTLTKYLGGGSVYSREGNLMKARGEWAESVISEEAKFSNTSGFTALPSGYRRSNGNFERKKYATAWWISDGSNIGILNDQHGTSKFLFLSQQSGLSVRLIEANNFSLNKELNFLLQKGNQKYELTILTGAQSKAKLIMYKDNIISYNNEGEWRLDVVNGKPDKITVTLLEQTGGGYEKSYKTVNYGWEIVYDELKNINYLTNGDGTWINKTKNQINKTENQNKFKEVDFLKVLGTPKKFGSLEVAQYDFPNRMKWDDANRTCLNLGQGWRLPTKEELNILYNNKNQIGNLQDPYLAYWSSTEFDNNNAWYGVMKDGFTRSTEKFYESGVRAVRTIQ